MNAISPPGCALRPADPLVFPSSGNASKHAELLSICERLASVWGERARRESELWSDLRLELGKTSSLTEALQAYSENAAMRMRMALENAQRAFEEQQQITARFSCPRDQERHDALGASRSFNERLAKKVGDQPGGRPAGSAAVSDF